LVCEFDRIIPPARLDLGNDSLARAPNPKSLTGRSLAQVFDEIAREAKRFNDDKAHK